MDMEYLDTYRASHPNLDTMRQECHWRRTNYKRRPEKFGHARISEHLWKTAQKNVRIFMI